MFDLTFYLSLFGTLIFFLVLFSYIYFKDKYLYDLRCSKCNIMLDAVVSGVKCCSYKSDGVLVNVYYPIMCYNVNGVEYNETSLYGFENNVDFCINEVKKNYGKS